MGNDILNAIALDIETAATNSMIEGTRHQQVETILDTIVKKASDIVQALDDLEHIKNTLYTNFLIYVQEVDEIIQNGKYNEEIENANELLMSISLINKSITEIENKVTLLSQDNKIEKETKRISVDYLTKPKRMIIKPSVLHKLKDIPVEELHDFEKEFRIIQNGGGVYNSDFKRYKKKDKPLDDVEAYRSNQARIYTTPITGDIIYVFCIKQKKGNWPRSVKESIASCKLTLPEFRKLKKELEENPEETERKFAKNGEYYKDIESIFKIVSNEKTGEDADTDTDTYISTIADEVDNDSIIEDGINVVNTILDTSYRIEELKNNNADIKTVIERIREYIYDNSIDIISIDNDGDETTIESLIETLNKLIIIEGIFLSQFRYYYMDKSDLTEEEKQIESFERQEIIELDKFEEENKNKKIFQKRGILRKQIRITTKRLLYLLDVAEKENEILKEVEFQIKIRGNVK